MTELNYNPDLFKKQRPSEILLQHAKDSLDKIGNCDSLKKELDNAVLCTTKPNTAQTKEKPGLVI